MKNEKEDGRRKARARRPQAKALAERKGKPAATPLPFQPMKEGACRPLPHRYASDSFRPWGVSSSTRSPTSSINLRS